ncbi:acyl-CoA thioesterase [Marinagarivorans cellulosilyticus]|uniref:Acyl-CoA thioesterase YciA n=1 Tax=Marinagarivorans cellulosilyticus TaxID=2721545 RepID=A0AAN1WGP7_9GAMM|nr:acyl-CoA thioesterase [Marinagarivorans cellulosilyticus]BCD97269.1 acyl-CoA thioesterase YciA [Marinagarivorans cellulosilyticus]
MIDSDEDPTPSGELALQTLTRPQDTNSNGDIFGGWLMGQMDLAGAITARELARGPVTTVAVGAMVFLSPIKVGAIVSCYCEVAEVGRSSIRINIEVWTKHYTDNAPQKVTDAEFVFVAIDKDGRTRTVPSPAS